MKSILLCFGLLITISSYSQEREIQGALLFSRQSQIDSFRIYYPTATSLTNLLISGPDITNLDSLIGLTRIYSDFQIYQNPLLQSLHGLDELQFVEESFYINGNYSLTNLSGLEKLYEVKKTLYVADNPNLKNLKGLEGLRLVNKLDIIGNVILESLDGLENLANSGISYYLKLANCFQLSSLKALENQKRLFGLTISQCNSLPTLNDFKQLEFVRGLRLFRNTSLLDIAALHTLRNFGAHINIDIQENPRLKSLFGLDSLTELDNLFIIENDSLISLEGLNQVKSIGGNTGIRIISNLALNDISALSGISNLDGELELKDNPFLFTCDYQFICEYVQSTTNPNSISHNLTSCNSIPAVITSCDFEGGQARGLVYLDMNCNQNYDPDEYALPYYILEDVETHKPLIATDTTGRYIRYLHYNDSLEWQPRSLPRFSVHPLSQHVEVGSQSIDLDQLDFALCPDTLYHDVSVSLSPFTDIRPGFFSGINIGVENKGTYVEKGVKLTLEFETPPPVDSFEITSSEGNAMIAGQIATWQLPDLIPFQKLYFPVIVYVGSKTLVGVKIIAHALVESQSVETDLQNNTALVKQEVVGSIDPNDKWVSRSQIRSTDEDSTLEYIIRFQNTGNFPATFIEVVDTIESSLDLSSFDMISASHDYVLIFPEENIIKWRFDNIGLPDSATNEQASHGYVHFSIKPSNHIEIENGISNSASIYFDFNAPVRTNKTLTKVEVVTSLNEGIEDGSLNLWPNPVEDIVNIGFELKSSAKTTLDFYSIDGHPVYHEDLGFLNAGSQHAVVRLNDIMSGVYIIHLRTISENIVGKVVMKYKG